MDYLRDSLFEIRNTSVTLSEVSHLPDGELFKTEERTVQLSSERLDALIAKVFFLSRDASQALFKRGLVFVSGKLIESVSYTPKKDDIISVRGYGRMKYLSYESLSRKGKLNARVALYI